MTVKEMGTAFGGAVDLTVQVAEDGNSVAVNAELKKPAVQPKEIRIRLPRATAGR